MSNLKTTLFQGDVYIEASSDPLVYGTGNLDIEGDISVSGGITIGGSSAITGASNIGVGGVGVFNGLSGSTLQFRNINAGSNKVTVFNDSGNAEIDIDIDPANIPHSGLSGLASGDDHTQYGLLAGRVGGQVFIGGTGSGNTLTLRSTTNATKGSVLIDETTTSTSTTTGALRVGGGVGIVGNTYIGGTGNVAGVLSATSGTASSSISTGALVVTGGTGISGNLNVGGNVNISGTFTASIAHSSLTGLTTGDDHTQYTLLAGRVGGQVLTGGTASGNTLTLRSTSNVTKGSVIIDETTASSSTVSGALRVSGGVGIVGNTFIGGTGNVAGVLNATSGTASTSTTSGALVVTGGAGISGEVFIGGTGNVAGVLNATSGTVSSSTTTGALVVTGGAGVSGNVFVGGNLNVAGTFTASIAHSSLTGLTVGDDHTQYALLAGRVGGQVLTGGTASGNILTLRSTSNVTKGSVLIDETTTSSSTSTGALRVGGGAGIVGNVFIGGTGNVAGVLSATSGTASTSTTSGALVVTGGAGVSGAVFIGGTGNVTGVLNATSGTTSTSTTSGALVVTGGSGISGNLFVGGTGNVAGVLSATSGTASTSTTTGALVVTGGSGISGNVFVGGNLNVAGTLTASIAHSSLTGLTTGDDHTQYSLLAGRVGGQVLTGGTASGNTLTLRSTSNVTKGSVLVDETTTSSSVSTGALVVSGGAGIAGNVFIGGTGNVAGVLNATSGTASTSTTSGALVVTGGAGVSGNVFVGGNLNIAGTLTASIAHSSLTGLTTGDDHTQYTLLAGRVGGQVLTGGTASGNTLTLRSTSNVTKGSVIIDETTASSSTVSGALRVAGGVGIVGNTFIGGTGNVAGVLNATSGTASTSTTTGALVVTGGAGVSGNLFVGGNLNIAGTVTASIAHSSLTGLTSGDDHTQYTLLAGRVGGQVITGGTGSGNTLTLRSTSNVTKGSILVDETTVSSSVSTGALVVSGGAGIAGNIFIGGTGNVAGILNATSGTASTSTSTGALVVTGGAGVSGAVFIGGTGNVAGVLNATSGTASTSTSTGALVVTGGAGVSGNVFVGGNLNIAGTLTASIAHSSLTGLTTGDDHTQYSLLAGRLGGQVLTGGTGSGNTLTLRSTNNVTKGSVLIDETTASSSVSTGALVVSGGVGVAGNIYSTGMFDTSNRVFSIAGTNLSSSGATVNVVSNPSFSGITNITNTTASTSISSGAFNVAGGISVSNTTDAVSASNGGTLTLGGGAGIAKKLFVGDVISASNTINMNNTKVINVATPTNPQDAANKAYVDNAVQGIDIKNSVAVATTGAGTLASSFQNGSSIDGITLVTGDRILIKNQASSIENGIYIVQPSGAPVRSSDFASSASVAGAFTFVEKGTVNAESGWVCTNDSGTDIVGTNGLTFVQFSGAGQIIAGTGLTKTGNTLSVNASQTQITDLGTITTGVWNASLISVTYGGTGNSTLTSNSILLGNGTGAIISSAMTYTSNTLNVLKISSTDTTASTSSSTGSITLSGGLGISNVTDASSSINGGSLTSAGGAAFAKSVFIGGNLTISGTLNASIAHSSLTGLTTGDDHTQYALLAGRVGGQILTGGTASGNTLTLRSTSNVTKGSVLIDETTTSTSTTTGALRVGGGVGIVGNTFIGGTGNVAGVLNATSGTASTSSTTGALVVTGGAGVSGAVFIGGTGNVAGVLNATSGTASTSTSTGALVVTGGAGVSGAVFIGGTGNVAGVLNATSGTASTSTSTGALVVTGGAGVSGNVFVGGNLNIAGTLTASIAHSSLTGLTTGDDHTQYSLLAGRLGGQVLTGGTGSGNTLTLRSTSNVTKGSVLVDETTASSSVSTGALVVSGGAGIGGNIFIGGTGNVAGILNATSGTASTSVTTGALVVTGGAGVSGNIFVGGNLNIAGTLTASIAHSSLTGLTTGDDHTQYALLAGRVGGQVLTGGTASGNTLTLRSTSNLTKGSVLVDETTTSTSTTTGALRVGGGVGIVGNTFIGGTGNIAGVLSATSGTASTSTTSGALVVTGGAGISGAVFIGGTGNIAGVLNATSGTSSTSSTTGAVVVTGGIGVSENVFIGGNLNVTGSITASIAHSSLTGLTTGDDHTQYALLAGRVGGQVLTGGTASGNTLTLRSTSNVTKGSVLIDETTTSSSTSTGALRVGGGAGIVGNVFVGGTGNVAGVLNATSGTASTSTTSGALVVTGGAGVSGSVFIGGTGNVAGVLNATSGTASTSTTTGALVVTGGTGISGNLNVGGNLNITGTVTASIAHSSLTGLTVGDDHTQYTLLAGRVGGQVLTGGTGSGNTLTLRSTSNVTKGSVLVDETTVSSSTSTGALVVSGGAGVAGNVFIGGTGNVAGVLNATSGTASTSVSTGALVVTGGAGISGNAFIGGTGNVAGVLNATSGTASTSTTTGALVVTGGTGISGNLNVGGNLNVTGTFSASIAHSSLTGLTTGDDHTQYALLVGRVGGQVLTGGTGISNTLTLRSTTNATKGSVLIDETTTSTSTTTGALRVGGGAGIVGNVFVGGTGNVAGVLNATSGTVSSSTTTGALVVTGGAGISGNAFIGGTGNVAGILNATSGTASSSTTTGALVVTGGAGVSGNVFIGGNLNIAGTLTASIAHSSLTGLTVGDDHTQYALLAGRVGGQILTGGTAASNTLTLRSTTNATKGSVLIDETTTSSSTTTGALRVGGGVGIVGNTFIGGTGNIAGVLSATSGTASTSTGTGALVVTGGVGISGSAFIGVNASVPTLTLPSTISITNPPASNIRLYQDNADGLLKSIDSTGTIEVYQPTTSLGDIPVNNGTTLDRFPVGTNNQMLIANSVQPLGLQWIDRPVFGTNYFSRRDSGSQTNTTTTFATRLTLTTGTLEAGSYIYTISGVQSNANSNQEHEARSLLDGVQQNILSFFGQNVVEWPVYFSDIVTLTAGVHTVSLEFRRVGTGTITSRNVLIYLYRVA